MAAPISSLRSQHSASYDAELEGNTGSSDSSVSDVLNSRFGGAARPSWSFSLDDIRQPPPPQPPHASSIDGEGVGDEEAKASSSAASEIAASEIAATHDLPEIRRLTEVAASAAADGDSAAGLTADEREQRQRDALAAEMQRGVLPVTTPQEDLSLEFRRYVYQHHTQVGAYMGATPASEARRRQRAGESGGLALRQRRELERVPQIEVPFEAAETSFRRLPEAAMLRMPAERFLRHSYPMKTDLPIAWKDADCADFNMVDIDEEAAPIQYGILFPKDYDPRREHPFLVWLSDHRGEHVDFEDCCAHLFARVPHYERWYNEGWVIVSPVVSMKNSQIHGQEGVVARFCDWICANYRVEHGRVHLGGKGFGGFAALRTVLEMKKLAISCTALLGRAAGPYRPLDRPQEKAANLMGTHVMMYVPGDMRKTDYCYKFKGFADLARVRPPVRAVHFAEIRDHQVYYAVNPTELWNHMDFYRRNNLHGDSVMTQ